MIDELRSRKRKNDSQDELSDASDHQEDLSVDANSASSFGSEQQVGGHQPLYGFYPPPITTIPFMVNRIKLGALLNILMVKM